MKNPAGLRQDALAIFHAGLRAADPAFARTRNLIIGGNIESMQAAGEKAEALGYRGLILSSFVEGETKEVAKVHAAIAKEIRRTGQPVPAPACVVSGGETVARARAMGLAAEDYLRENDSYHFFYALGDLLVTGPTFTNVMDLRLVLVG